MYLQFLLDPKNKSIIRISIFNDITREEMLYISLNKSKVVWTETKKSRVKPLSQDINTKLEELYQSHIEQCEINPDDKQLAGKKYHMEEYRVEIISYRNDVFIFCLFKGNYIS
jgi:hypothetical protein